MVLRGDGSDFAWLAHLSGINSSFDQNTGRAWKRLSTLLLDLDPLGWGDAPSCEATEQAMDAPPSAVAMVYIVNCDLESSIISLIARAEASG